MAVQVIEHIVKTPETCFGKPRIAGTRMRVQDVVYYHRVGWSADKIADQFYLTLGQVYAALSYYFDHQAEIDADLREDDEFAEQVAGQYEETKRRIEGRQKGK